MTPYDSYRLYQLERANNAAQARLADEQAGRLAAATSALLRGIAGRVRAMWVFHGSGRAGAPCRNQLRNVIMTLRARSATPRS